MSLIRDFLNKTKEILNLKTDEDLAIRIGATKSSIDKWVQRDTLPDKWKFVIEKLINEKNSPETITVKYYPYISNLDGISKIDEHTLYENVVFDKRFVGNLCNMKNCDSLIMIRVIGNSFEPEVKNGEFIVFEKENCRKFFILRALMV